MQALVSQTAKLVPAVSPLLNSFAARLPWLTVCVQDCCIALVGKLDTWSFSASAPQLALDFCTQLHTLLLGEHRALIPVGLLLMIRCDVGVAHGIGAAFKDDRNSPPWQPV